MSTTTAIAGRPERPSSLDVPQDAALAAPSAEDIAQALSEVHRILRWSASGVMPSAAVTRGAMQAVAASMAQPVLAADEGLHQVRKILGFMHQGLPPSQAVCSQAADHVHALVHGAAQQALQHSRRSCVERMN